MNIAIFFIAAVSTYLICALNPAIVLSTIVYKEDIREKGSKNPGFTNFKRLYGMKLAWLVMILDVAKAIVPEIIFGLLFEKLLGNRALGVAFTGVFALLGHSFPCWYGFKGGKGFLVLVGTLFVLHWPSGLIAFAVLVLFLFTLKYMSLATILCLISGCISTWSFMYKNLPACIMFTCCTLFMIYRHKENIKRLFTGTEKKFSFSSKKEKEMNAKLEEQSSNEKTE